MQEQSLRRREQELLVREFEVVEREIQLLMLQQTKPPLRKRTGAVRRKLLDKYRDGKYISSPSGTWGTHLTIHCRSINPLTPAVAIWVHL